MDAVFDDLVSEAIDHIPKKYRDRMDHVAILTSDRPTDEQRKKIGLRDCDSLFGLYEGVPMSRRNGSKLSIQPDIITIFKYPMIELFRDESALKSQIYKTLWHEVAHYFGLDHKQIHEISNK
ncbi:metallopeptidase family protein [Candidatus Saccharibacteria bacterium]|nr:metallopeptidase family protein [Candidatus Saccharibacteria bacterium]